MIPGLLAAWGGAATEEEASEPTVAPAATATTAPAAPTAPTATTAADPATEGPESGSDPALQTYADENAGGHEAIYVGDITQLAGPAQP